MLTLGVNSMSHDDVVVYVLGAGASHEDGAPLTRQLVDRAFWYFPARRANGTESLLGEIDERTEVPVYNRVLRALDLKYGTTLVKKFDSYRETLVVPWLSSECGLIRIETFLSEVDECRRTGTVPPWFVPDLGDCHSLLEDALFFFYHTLCLDTGLARRQPKHYLSFCEYALRPGKRHVILSFNYDYLLEEALWDVRRYWERGYRNRMFNKPVRADDSLCWSYCVDFVDIPNDCPYGSGKRLSASVLYLKLHGSLNWGLCPETGGVVLFLPTAVAWSYRKFRKGELKCHGGQHMCGPALIPPTLEKDISLHHLKELWRLARAYVNGASEINVIGYSLPPEDLAAQDLFREAGQHGQQAVVVANPSATDRQRIVEMFPNAAALTEYESFKQYLVQHHSADPTFPW